MGRHAHLEEGISKYASVSAYDHFRLVTDEMPAVMWTLDTDLHFTSSIGAGLVALGLEPNAVVGVHLFEYLQTDDPKAPAVDAHVRALAGERASFDIELNNSRFHCHVEPLRDAEQVIVGVIGLGLDVTARQRAEAALRQRIEAESLAADISRSFVGAQWQEIGPAVETALRRIASYFGADHAHLGFLSETEEQVYDILHAWNSPALDTIDLPASFASDDIAWIVRGLTGSGYLFLPDATTLPDGDVAGTHLLAVGAKSAAWIGMRSGSTVRGAICLVWRREPSGITEAEVVPFLLLGDVLVSVIHRQRVERHLHESRRQLSSLMSNLPGMAYRCRNDRDWTLEFVSDGCRDLTGYAASELINNRTRSYGSVIHPEDREHVWQIVQDAIDQKTAYRLVYRIRSAHAETKWVWEQGAGVFDRDGKLIALEGFITDISEQKRAEEEREEFVALVENTSDGIILASLEGRTTYVNPAGLQLLGVDSVADTIGVNVLDWYADGDQPDEREIPLTTARAGHRWDGDANLCDARTGAAIPVRQSVFLVRQAATDRPLCLGIVVRDMREQKKAQEALVRAKRLESAGQLAGQIAHDFNNLLGPLVAYPELIRSKVGANPDLLELLNDMEESARRIAEINRELLTLGRRGHYNLDAVDVNQLVEHALRSTAISPHVTITRELSPHLPRISGGAAQLARVFSNLITNAIDAMPEAGTLTVRTQLGQVDAPQAKPRPIPRGEYVRVEISDTGCGIAPDILDRVFEPFFTTKQADKRRGSGLGLAVVYSVVEDHGGYISVASEPGVGTTFCLCFPSVVSPAASSEPMHKIPEGHGEQILVVDDDVMQLRIAERMLTQLGYRARTAASGEEAVGTVAASPPDLVLLDMQMRGIDGAETLRQIRRIIPDQKALIISGYAGTERVSAALAAGASGFVQKPIQLNSLATAVHRALGVRQSTTATRQ